MSAKVIYASKAQIRRVSKALEKCPFTKVDIARILNMSASRVYKMCKGVYTMKANEADKIYDRILELLTISKVSSRISNDPVLNEPVHLVALLKDIDDDTLSALSKLICWIKSDTVSTKIVPGADGQCYMIYRC